MMEAKGVWVRQEADEENEERRTNRKEVV